MHEEEIEFCYIAEGVQMINSAVPQSDVLGRNAMSKEPRTLKVSDLRRCYEHKNRGAAISDLLKPYKLSLNDEMSYL
jgi:hypothetical protein